MIFLSELHVPSEIFGFPPSNSSNLANSYRKEFRCPFINKTCTKKSRLLDYPFGICSAWHTGFPFIICPNRFYFNDKALLKRISNIFLKEERFGLVSEVELKDFGNVDWVAYTVHKGDINDFCGIEISAIGSTGTGGLVKAMKDFKERGVLEERYNYGMNIYMAIKTSFTQMLNKGQVFENWGKKYVWVFQDVLFEDFTRRFDLKLERGFAGGQILIYVVKMVRDNERDVFDLKDDKVYSVDIETLLTAYKRQITPPIEIFVEAIKRKAVLEPTLHRT